MMSDGYVPLGKNPPIGVNFYFKNKLTKSLAQSRIPPLFPNMDMIFAPRSLSFKIVENTDGVRS